MASRAAAPPKSQRALVLLLAVVAAAAATYYRLPGALIGLVLVIVAVYQDVPPDPATGPPVAKNASPAAVAVADPAFAKRQRVFRRWRMVRTSVIFNKDMLPGWPPALDWFQHVGLAVLVASIPVTSPAIQQVPVAQWGPVLNGWAAFALATAIFRAKRATELEGDELPRITVAHIAGDRKKAIPAIGLGAVVGVVLAVLLGPVVGLNVPLACVGAALMLAAVLGRSALDRTVIAPVRQLADQRMEWYSRWLNLKIDPPHRLVDRKVYGDDPEAPALIVETFDTDPRSAGSAGALTPKVSEQLASQVPGGFHAVTAEVEAVDSSGSPIPYSTDPRRFCVRSWPNTGLPAIWEAGISQELAEQTVTTALVNFSRRQMLTGVRLEELTRISLQAPETPAEPPAASDDAEEAAEAGELAEPAPQVTGSLWQIRITGMDGLTLRSFASEVAASVGMEEMLVDHRAGTGYLGDFGTPLAPDSPVTPETFDRIMEESQWNQRWESLMKSGANPPTPKFDARSQASLTGMRRGSEGAVLKCLPFVAREGMSLEEVFFPMAPNLKAALYSSTFTALLGFTTRGGRPGSRHNLAFNVVYSEDQGIPSRPDDLIPPDGRGRAATQAHHWVLAGLLNQAFRAAKLSQPELISAEPMTAGFLPGRPGSVSSSGARQRKHIWALHVRLYGPDTLKSVRDAAEKIRTSWASAWLRVAPADEGVMIYVGHTPSEVSFISGRQMSEVDRLDWEQVFLDSKMASTLGVTPKLISSELLETNHDVKVLTFSSVGSGVTYSSVVGSVEKLSANSGYGWIQPVRVESDPQAFVLRCAASDPMPRMVPHDWEKMTSGRGITFGVDIEGAGVVFDPRDDPHLLLAGGTGSGKSVTLQSMIASSLLHGWETYVIDVPKGAADFQFAIPWLRAAATDTRTALAVLRAVYQEVTSRKAVNAREGVGNYRDLPESIRPKHILVLIDEFTSTIIAETVPAVTGDVEADAAREVIKARNQMLLEMGDLVGRIGREARSAGVSMVLATQSLKADTLSKARMPADMKDNLSRAGQGKLTSGQRTATLKEPYDAPDLGDSVPTGRGVLESSRGFAVYQSFYHPDEGAHLAAGLRERIGEPEQPPAVDLEPFMPAEIVQRPAIQELTSDPDAPVVTELLGDLDFSDLDFDFDEADAAATEPDEGAEPEPAFTDAEPEPAARVLPPLPPLTPVDNSDGSVDNSVWSVDNSDESVENDDEEKSEGPGLEAELEPVGAETATEQDDAADAEPEVDDPDLEAVESDAEPEDDSDDPVDNEPDSVDNSDERPSRRPRSVSVEDFVQPRARRRRPAVSLEDFMK